MGYSNLLLPVFFTVISILSIVIISLIIYTVCDFASPSHTSICVHVLTQNISNIICGHIDHIGKVLGRQGQTQHEQPIILVRCVRISMETGGIWIMAVNGDFPQVFTGGLHTQASPEYAALIDSGLFVLDPMA